MQSGIEWIRRLPDRGLVLTLAQGGDEYPDARLNQEREHAPVG